MPVCFLLINLFLHFISYRMSFSVKRTGPAITREISEWRNRSITFYFVYLIFLAIFEYSIYSGINFPLNRVSRICLSFSQFHHISHQKASLKSQTRKKFCTPCKTDRSSITVGFFNFRENFWHLLNQNINLAS